MNTIWLNKEERLKSVGAMFGSAKRRYCRHQISRQLDEAIRLQKEEGMVMNDKNEWTRPAGFTVIASRM